MTQTDEYVRARGRAKAKYNFFVHAVVFAIVMALLVIINLVTKPQQIWFIWPLLGWGVAVALHAASVYLMADKEEIIDEMTERELRHSSTGKTNDRPQ